MKKLMVTALALVLVMGGEPLWGMFKRKSGSKTENATDKTLRELPFAQEDTIPLDREQPQEKKSVSDEGQSSKGRLQRMGDSVGQGWKDFKTGFQEKVSVPIREKYISTKTSVTTGAENAWKATKNQASFRKNQIKAKLGSTTAQAKVLRIKGEEASNANKELALDKINVRQGKEKVRQEALANDIAALNGLLGAEKISDNRKAALESLKNRKERSLLTSQSNEALILRQKALLEGNADEAVAYKVISNLRKLDRDYVGKNEKPESKFVVDSIVKELNLDEAKKESIRSSLFSIEEIKRKIDTTNNEIMDLNMRRKDTRQEDKNELEKNITEKETLLVDLVGINNNNRTKLDPNIKNQISLIDTKNNLLQSETPIQKQYTPSPALRAQIEAITAKNATVAGAKYVGGKTKEGGKAVKEGIEKIPGKIASGATAVSGAIRTKAGEAYDAATFKSLREDAQETRKRRAEEMSNQAVSGVGVSVAVEASGVKSAIKDKTVEQIKSDLPKGQRSFEAP